MSEFYSFDASKSVDAESIEAAADLILERCIEGDMPVMLCTEGTLNQQTLLAKVDELETRIEAVKRCIHYQVLIDEDGRTVNEPALLLIHVLRALHPQEPTP